MLSLRFMPPMAQPEMVLKYINTRPIRRMPVSAYAMSPIWATGVQAGSINTINGVPTASPPLLKVAKGVMGAMGNQRNPAMPMEGRIRGRKPHRHVLPKSAQGPVDHRSQRPHCAGSRLRPRQAGRQMQILLHARRYAGPDRQTHWSAPAIRRYRRQPTGTFRPHDRQLQE